MENWFEYSEGDDGSLYVWEGVLSYRTAGPSSNFCLCLDKPLPSIKPWLPMISNLNNSQSQNQTFSKTNENNAKYFHLMKLVNLSSEATCMPPADSENLSLKSASKPVSDHQRSSGATGLQFLDCQPTSHRGTISSYGYWTCAEIEGRVTIIMKNTDNKKNIRGYQHCMELYYHCPSLTEARLMIPMSLNALAHVHSVPRVNIRLDQLTVRIDLNPFRTDSAEGIAAKRREWKGLGAELGLPFEAYRFVETNDMLTKDVGIDWNSSASSSTSDSSKPIKPPDSFAYQTINFVDIPPT